MDITSALPLLQETINKHLRHKDYARVCKLAEDYTILVTGERHEKLLKQFVRREDDALFAQRVALTSTITPAVCGSLMNPFFRVGRLDNVKKELDYESGTGNSNDSRVMELEERINAFFGEDSLDKYMQDKFITLNFTDPNAFIITTVDRENYDPRYEKPYPYPLEYTSEEAIDYNYVNNTLQYLTVKYAIYYDTRDGVQRIGEKYLMFLPDVVLEYKQVEFATTERQGNIPLGYETDDKRQFDLTIHEAKTYGEVQAVRVGYKKDNVTRQRTCVSPFHDALGYFMKTVKAVSEMDLTMALHAFPQKVQYGQPCPGEDPEQPMACTGKSVYTGKTCTVCKGTGHLIHTSAQDAITLPMPKHSDEMFKLEELIVYKYPPIELLKFQKEYIEQLKIDVTKAVFNSDVTEKPSIAATATEVVVNKEEMYNTLFPFTEHYSTVWKTCVRLIAAFTDNRQGLEVMHEFPSDFKLKTLSELYDDLKRAKESGASDFALQAIEEDIARKINADDPDGFKRFAVKRRFMPFLGKTSEEIQFILSTGRARKEDEILWTHSDTIMDDLENEVEGFFDLPYRKQRDLIMQKVQTISNELSAQQPVAIPFRVEQTQEIA